MFEKLKARFYREYTFKILIPLHVMGAWGLWHGRDFSFAHFAAFFFFWMLFGGLGIEVGFHRLFSHRAFECSSTMKIILSLLGVYGAQWSAIWWSALHTGVHHRHSDLAGDPHSPVDGFWHAYLGWNFTFNPRKVSFAPVKALLSSPTQRFLHNWYSLVFWLPVLLLTAADWKLGMCVFIFPAMASIHQESLVNSLCHSPRLGGYRNHEIADRSANWALFGWLILGAGFHNNHHPQPRRYNLGERVWEIDPCRFFVPTLLWIDRLCFAQVDVRAAVCSDRSQGHVSDQAEGRSFDEMQSAKVVEG
jgi:stearoyl-CoA desaturase (delta-9 desaturase)